MLFLPREEYRRNVWSPRRRSPTNYDAYNAEEAFLASTSPTIVPVQSIGGVKPTAAIPGPVTKRLIQAWSEMVGVDIVAQALNHLDAGEREFLAAQWRDRVAA